MEKLHFTANYIQNEWMDEEILVVGFHHDDHYVIIQLAEEFDKQEVRLGMDTYHIERDSQAYGNYGCVEQVSLHPNQVLFRMNDKGKQYLQCDEISIDFEMTQDEYPALLRSLRKIFGEALEAV